MNTRSWLAGFSSLSSAPRRRRVCGMTDHAEVCEERILLSASVPMTGPSRAASTSPRVGRSPSTGGPNGTVFLSPVLMPANSVEVPGPAIAASPDSLAFVVSSFGPVTSAPTVPASLSGGVPTGFSTSMDQMLSNSQIFGPQFGVTLSTVGSGGYSTSVNNTPSANNTGVSTASQSVGVSGTGLMEPLPAIDLDLAFTPAIDLTVSLVW
jgi:hypothetical protein